jgi:hypothetical protein
MKKSRIFMATGGFVLAVAGMFATKANRKFVAVTTAETHAKFLNIADATLVTVSGISSGHFTSSKGTGASTAFIGLVTANNGVIGKVTLVTTTGLHTQAVYYY